jgi:metal-responsive CopG/Arc/MetJ family transcriptional regulator
MSKYTLYANDNFLKKADTFVEGSPIKSRSELIVKAVDFYIDYNNNKEAGKFLAREIQAIMTKNIKLSEERLGDRLEKILYEIDIQINIQQKMLRQIKDNQK